MKLGEKIKFIRTLRGMTQKDLGLKVGFSAATADNRIRQYEMGKMKPKADKIELLAKALEVSPEIINDNDIDPDQSNAVINLLFEMERTMGLRVTEINGQYVLNFDEDAEYGNLYSDVLKTWYKAKNRFFPSEESKNDKKCVNDYLIWTQEYHVVSKDEEKRISNQIKEKYKDAIAKASMKLKIKTVSDYIKIFEKMICSGVYVEISKNPELSSQGKLCVRIRLTHANLLELEPKAIKAYADFCAMIQFFQKKNQEMLLQTYNDNQGFTYDEYNIMSSPLSSATIGVVPEIQSHIDDGSFWDPDYYEVEYDDYLDTYNIPIEDAIVIDEKK